MEHDPAEPSVLRHSGGSSSLSIKMKVGSSLGERVTPANNAQRVGPGMLDY